MEFCKQLENLVNLLVAERKQAANQGYNTVTLTSDEVAQITKALSQANQKIVHSPHH